MITRENGHRKHELRSLAMHRRIAEELAERPDWVIHIALENIARWKANGVECADLDVWEEILHQPPETILKTLTGTDETSTRLRQSSPFPGIISQAERSEIFAAFP